MDGKRADKRVNDMEEDRRRGPLVEVAGCGRFYWYSIRLCLSGYPLEGS